MSKTETAYFRDWEAFTFGYGYGSGETHVIHALKTFFGAIGDGPYDFRSVEAACGPIPAWLLINTLCGVDIIEYGTSPRFGWLTEEGKRLRSFLAKKTEAELTEILTAGHEAGTICGPDYCNCEDGPCHNPFWV